MTDPRSAEQTGDVWPRLFDSIDDALCDPIDWRGASGPDAYVESCMRVAAALDHRCEQPAVVAAGLLIASQRVVDDRWGLAAPKDVLENLSAKGHQLCAEVWEHPEDPSPDASVLSDALLHPAGADSARTFDGFGAALESVLMLEGRPFPPLAQLRSGPSVFYTPEARSRLEARCHLNIWRQATGS